MNKVLRLVLIAVVIPFAITCGVETSDIETWKGTQNGPKKIAGVLIDPSMPLDLRSRAALALIDINRTDLFLESLRKVDAADADRLIQQAAPLFIGKMNPAGTNPGMAESTLTPDQVHAKDGLYLMYDFAGEASKPLVEKALVSWCAEGNFSVRAMAGYDLRVIARKIGAAAALPMSRLLTIDQSAVRDVAELLREIGDVNALEAASSVIADTLTTNRDGITPSHLEAAAIVGGGPAAAALLRYATDAKIGVELQRKALRAYSLGLERKSIVATTEQLDQLLAVAQDTGFDRIHREETWMTLSQIPLPGVAEKLATLLESPELIFRLVGIRLLLRVDPDTWIARILATRGLIREPADVESVLDVLCRFPKIAPLVALRLADQNAVSRGLAIRTLEVIGKKEQLPALEAALQDKAKLPEGFTYGTIAEAAAVAVDAIRKKG